MSSVRVSFALLLLIGATTAHRSAFAAIYCLPGQVKVCAGGPPPICSCSGASNSRRGSVNTTGVTRGMNGGKQSPTFDSKKVNAVGIGNAGGKQTPTFQSKTGSAGGNANAGGNKRH
jgi:hypothetical protein